MGMFSVFICVLFLKESRWVWRYRILYKNGFFSLFEPKEEEFTSKYIRAQGKIFVRASLEKHVIPYAGPVVKIHVRNDRLSVPVTLLDLLWINMYDHEIVTMDNVSQPITLSKSKYTAILINEANLCRIKKFVITFSFQTNQLISKFLLTSSS